MILFFFLATLSAWAEAPLHWSHILEVSDRHEFYQNDEVIKKPRDTWQTLFSLVYLDKEIHRLKDCLFLKVPGDDPGIIKLKTISASVKCDNYVLEPGDREVRNIKTFQFSIFETEVLIDFTLADFKAQKWQASLQSSFQKPRPQMNLSSAEFKSPKIIFLAPSGTVKSSPKTAFLKEKTLCHEINEDCQEVSPSMCSQCEGDWFEVPNGCDQGPKYCGLHKCGTNDRPACRRGMKWQRSQSEFDCRTDSSFAYCSKGLKVTCEGRKAFCR
jgi:hypothetical protein